MLISRHQNALIHSFVADYGTRAMQVRSSHLAKSLCVSELRSKRHDHLAIQWDEIGNAFVLTAHGQRLNLYPHEIAKSKGTAA